MDTPERSQIGKPLSEFEESPFFSYISNLSPIKPVESVHDTQTFNSLSFSSPLSVFTSPHVSSVRESRFLRSHNIADLSIPKALSENENKVSSEDVTIDAINTRIGSNEEKDDTGIRVLTGNGSIELPEEDTDFTIELPKELKYESGSPDCEQETVCEHENSSALQLPSEEVSLFASIPGSENEPSEEEVQVVHISDICCFEPKAEGAECNWEGLIADATDLLIFNSPNDKETFKDLMQRPSDPPMRFCTIVSQLSPNGINRQKFEVIDQITSSQCRTDCHSSHPETECEQIEVHQSIHTRDYRNVAKMDAIRSGKTDNKSVFIMHRGFRRRSLDFEMTGGRKKTLGEGSSSDSCISPSDEKIKNNDMQTVPSKQKADSQRCILPGIGLHLNSLATLTDHRDNRHESRQSSCSSIHFPATSQEHLLSVVTPPERDVDVNENEAQLAEDGSQPSAYWLAEDFSQNSPKKKRSKLEVGGESEGCKRCNCKKSKCLKLYCECFSAGVYCIEPCSCQDCFNKPIYEDKVLETRKQIESRNPLAFAPKVIRSSDFVPEIRDESNKTPASARHKRGCNCKKSNCLKKYCECYQGGVGCSVNCRCEGCKNKFGTKDGFIPNGTETEPEETEACENSTVEKRVNKMDIQNNEEHMAATPLRSLVPLPFSSKRKPPRSSFVTRGSYAGNRLEKSNFISQQKLEKFLETVPDDEMPEILRGDRSPVNCMKTSPNGKRVSPPHCNFAGVPTRRSGRKLILQSIPSFPSLTQH